MTKRIYTAEQRASKNARRRAARIKACNKVRIASRRPIIMAMISEKAITPTGFTASDAGGASQHASKVCAKLMKAGALYRAQIKRYVFYFTTQEAADARLAESMATPRKPRTHTPASHKARQRITELSMRAQGVQRNELTPRECSLLENTVTEWVDSGKLIRVKLQGVKLRYFANQALADDFAGTYRKPEPTPKAYKPKVPTPKAPKLTAIIRLPNVLITQTKPTPGLAAKREREIVYPERYRHSSRPWVDLRAVSVQRQYIGQPGGFAMSI